MKTEPLRILILEDNSAVIEELKRTIAREFSGAQVTVEVATEKLERLVDLPADRFDVILLDYLCITGGNFHQAPLEHFGIERVISMSSTQRFNDQAVERGAALAIQKPLLVSELPVFAKQIMKAIDRILPKDQARRTDAFVSPSEADKKARERELIEKFLNKAQDFPDWKFAQYDENPDLIYQRDGQQLGFESIIVSIQPDAISCFFDTQLCRVTSPSLDTPDNLEALRQTLLNNLLNHLRRYKVPTIIVVTLIGTELSLAELARHLRLPEITQHNIRDYYLMRGDEIYKVAETQPL